MGASILIADDTSAILDALQWLLEDAGYLVECTRNSAEVIPLMLEKHPDLVLLDVWMPGTDGRDLCKQMKQQEALRPIPVLLMSAHRDLKQMSEQAGADGYLLKPFDMGELLTTIDMALRNIEGAHLSVSQSQL